MRVLVCGSRHYEDYKALTEELDKLENVDCIIHGAAYGADNMSGCWAMEKGIPTQIFPADWKKHGKAAGQIRNKQMLDEGKPDQIVAFLAIDSRGTKNMIQQAEKAGVPVKVINI